MLRRAEQFGCDPHRSIADVYALKESVGTGGKSVVHKAVHLETGVRRVVKQAMFLKDSDVDALMCEAKMLKRVGTHPKVVPLVECFVDTQAAYMVVEMCFGMDLFDWIESFNGSPPEEYQVAKLLQDMAMGVQHCHLQGVLHQDVKLENFVFQSNDGSLDVRLIDFGCADAMDGLSMRQVGSPGRAAPELKQGMKSPAGDVFSLGIALFTMLSGGIMPSFEQACRPSKEMTAVLDRFSKEAKDLCFQMLKGNPDERPTLEMILEHPFVAMASEDDHYGHAVNLDKGLRLLERVHSLCQAFLNLKPEEPPWIMHVSKGQTVSIECLVLSGVLQGTSTLRLGPGELTHGRSHVAVTDATVLNITARTYASLNTAGQVGRRQSNAGGDWCTPEFVRSAERRVQVLARLFLIMCEKPESLRPRKLHRGRILVQIGDDSDEAYVVLSGSLEVLGAEGLVLCEIGAGQVVGEMAALHGQKRSATLKALDNAMVLPILPQILRELQDGSDGFRHLKETADQRDMLNRRVDFLRENPLFDGFNPQALYEMAQALQPRFIPAGEELYAEGAISEHLFLVQRGQLLQEHGDAVSSQGSGAILGEISLVFNTVRAATVSAITDCELLALAKADFDTVLERHPQEKLVIAKIAAGHRSELLRKAEGVRR